MEQEETQGEETKVGRFEQAVNCEGAKKLRSGTALGELHRNGCGTMMARGGGAGISK